MTEAHRRSRGLKRMLAIAVAGIGSLCFSAAQADDDNTPLPPLSPGPGYEGILSNPQLPPGYVIDQSTRPYGVTSVFNSPQLKLGQSFTPSSSEIDWIAFVFQNTTQTGPEYPPVPGPGLLRLSLYAALDVSSGNLSGLLGTTNEVSIPNGTTQWLTFTFPTTLSVTPGETYFALIENVAGGYPSWVGGRTDDNVYTGGRVFGYLLNQFNGQYQRITSFDNDDLVFAVGVVPEPRAVLMMLAGLGLTGAVIARRRARAARSL